NGMIGESPYSANVMVRLLTQVDILAADTYTFAAVGGADRRLLVDGTPVTGARAMSVGRHTLEARFTVASQSNLPLAVTYARGGGPQADIAANLLTHDQTTVRPVINSMPTGGSAQGGEQIEIKGLGFFPPQSVVVRWGAQTISGTSLTVTPASVRLTA